MVATQVDSIARARVGGEGPADDRNGRKTSSLLSVLLPIDQDHDGLPELLDAYDLALERLGVPLELIYVIDIRATLTLEVLKRKQALDPRVRLIVVRQWPGEASAIALGFEQAAGDTILTLPPFAQVDTGDIGKVVAALDRSDMAVGSRNFAVSRARPPLGRAAFHWLLHALFNSSFADLPCRVRACHREVMAEILTYGGVQHHFLPLLASERGFKVTEVDVRPGALKLTNPFLRQGPSSQFALMLDILSLYVVLRFLKRPLRFFGAFGLPILALGLLLTAMLVFSRVFLGEALGERPLFVIGVLLIVLGVQMIALGLIGEIIIFTSGKRIKDYTVDKLIGGPSVEDAQPVDLPHLRSGGPAGSGSPRIATQNR